MKYTIDAKGRTIGRIAAEAAKLLLGKDSTSFTRNQTREVTVSVVNAAAIAVSEKKSEQKTYHRHSGYPGGDKRPTLAEVITKKGKKEALRYAISGMLPKNTLRERRLKNLIIEE